MSGRYIDADELLNDLQPLFVRNGNLKDEWMSYCVEKTIKNQPIADVVEVVRCKDCIHCADDWNGNQPMFTCEIGMCDESVEPNGYCFYGERGTDAEIH